MRIMGLDIGTKRIGVAVSDESCTIAQGRGVVERKNLEFVLSEMKKIVEEYSVREIVVGLPINMNGTLGERAKDSEEIAKRLEEKLNLPVKLWDERRSLGGRWSWFLKPYLVNRLKMLEELGVEIEPGKVITLEAVAYEKPDVVIAGRGLSATSAVIPGLENVPSIEADDILDGNVTAKGETAVLGGGNIGFEVANFLVRQGSQVQVIEEGSTLGHGIEPMTRKILRRQLVERGVVMYRLARVTRVEAGILTFVDEQGTEQRLPFDHLVLAYNREPNEEMIGLLRGGNYELIQAGPYQQPGQYVRAFDEGTSIGRAI